MMTTDMLRVGREGIRRLATQHGDHKASRPISWRGTGLFGLSSLSGFFGLFVRGTKAPLLAAHLQLSSVHLPRIRRPPISSAHTLA